MLTPSNFQIIKFNYASLSASRHWVLLIGMLCLLSSNAWGQTGRVHDSLRTSLSVQTTAKDSVHFLYKLLRLNLQARPDTAYKYLEILKGIDLQDDKQKGELIRIEAQYWKKKKDLVKSSNLYKRCINESADNKQSANCHFGLASNYMYQGALDLAIKEYLVAIDLFIELSEKGRLASTYNKLGRCLEEAAYYSRSIDIFKKALIIEYELGDDKGAMQFEKNLADVLRKDGRTEEAAVHYSKAYKIAQNLDRGYMIHSLHLDFAEKYLKESNLDSANYYANKAYDFYNIQSRNYPSMINARMVLGDIRLAEGKVNESIVYYKSGLKLALERKRTYQIIEANKNLSRAYELLDDDAKAIYHLKTATIMNDSIIHIESQRRIATLNEAYDSEKKDLEIVGLNSLNSIQKLELSRSRIQTLFALFGALGISLLALLFYRSLKQKRESEKVLNEKNKIISSALADKELLLKEIHHRVKNNLQIVSSLLGLQSEYIKDDSALIAINEGRNRVQSMALIHQNLYKEDNLTGINIKSYLEKLIAGLFDTYNLDAESIKLILNIEDVNLDVDTVVPIGLIANELVSNALKHAFKDQNDGELAVTLFQENERLIFSVKDNGVGMDVSLINDEMSSFGFQMIQAFKEKMEAELIVESEGGTSITLIMSDYKAIN